MTAYHLTRH